MRDASPFHWITTALLSLAAVLSSGQALALRFSAQLGEAGAAAPALAGTATGDLQALEEIVASEALARLGTHYELGSRRGDTVDCSSLIQQIYRAAGVNLPRTTREQIGQGVAVAAADLKKGDLVFYRWQKRNLHVAVYLDDGYIVHASPGQGRVVLTRLSPSWERRLVAARRLLI